MMPGNFASQMRVAFFEHGRKDRFQLARRRADDAQDIRCRGLLLQRLPQFIEQPRVLDGDDGLSGEALHECDLLASEGAHFRSVDADGTDQFIVFEHRHCDKAARAGHPDEELRVPRVSLIGRVLGHIGSLDRSFGPRDLCDYRGAGHAHQRLALSEIDIRGRCVVHRHGAISLPLTQEQHAEIGLAEACRIFQDDRKSRF